MCSPHYPLFTFIIRNVSEPVIGPPTNNVAEIEAATKAIQVAKSCGIDSNNFHKELSLNIFHYRYRKAAD